MTTYKSKISGATQNRNIHRRSHNEENSYFRGMSLSEIGAYTVISNKIFADGGPTIPVHDRKRMTLIIGGDQLEAERILSKLEDIGLVGSFEGHFITLAQELTFKKAS